MKKIYSLLLAGLTTVNLNAQLTMLRQWHEPVQGEQTGVRAFDSTSAIPKNKGFGQTWDFTSLSMNPMGPTSSSFVAPSAVPASSMFAGVTLVESQSGTNTFFKSSTGPDVFEGLGYQSSLATVNYSTDAMTVYAWPISYGTSFTDTYAGGISGLYNGALNGTLQTAATGDGTLTMPGGAIFSDVLQLTSTQSATISNNGGTITNVGYSYFHSTQKFPLLSVNYFRLQSTSGSVFTCSVLVNKLLAVGVNEEIADHQFALFPNPARDAFFVTAKSSLNEKCTISIYNSCGQLLRMVEIEAGDLVNKRINTYDMPSGVYLIKAQIGDKFSTKKILVD